ncbi:MAG: hypothetical protein ACOC4Z_02995 [Patescibacteria group bacterium]
MDARNTFTQHFIVGISSFILAFCLHFFLGTRWSTSFAQVSFILLFLTLFIGPATKLRKPQVASTPLKLPWSWRSELGIWFTITSLIHFYFVMGGRPNWNLVKALGGGIGGGGYGLSNLLGLVALVWALILTATSFGKIIKWLGIESWRWLHSFTYVIFYLVTAHAIYFQFFSSYGSGPDHFGYLYLVMFLIITTLQLAAFTKTFLEQRKNK